MNKTNFVYKICKMNRSNIFLDDFLSQSSDMKPWERCVGVG